MSIATAITAAQGRVADCYTAISNKGGTLPQTQNLANMPTAIGSIPTSSGSTKYGVSIDNMLGNVDSNGVLQVPYNTTGDIDFTGVKDIEDYALSHKFYYNQSLTHGVSFTDLENLSGEYCLHGAFQYTNISSVSFPKLKTITGSNALYYAFGYTQITTLTFPELEIASSSYAFRYLCYQCHLLEKVYFTKLSDVSAGMAIFLSAFGGCRVITDIYFNALTTISFGTYTTQFQNMFSSGSAGTAATSGNVNVHFPSNLSSTISGLTGYPLFGGASGRVTLLFDLPQTS